MGEKVGRFSSVEHAPGQDTVKRESPPLTLPSPQRMGRGFDLSPMGRLLERWVCPILFSVVIRAKVDKRAGARVLW